MTWRDAIGLAGRELRRRPGRAALTLMAITLATALLSALLAVAGTAQTRVLSQIANGGPLASISVAPAAPDPTQAGLDNPRSGSPRDLTTEALARIRSLPHVRSVVPVVATDVELVPPLVPRLARRRAGGRARARPTRKTAMSRTGRSGQSPPSWSVSTSISSGTCRSLCWPVASPPSTPPTRWM